MRKSRISGALYGVALGDALGRGPEFMSLGEIYRRYGRSGVMKLPDPALVTDDTQMTIAVGRALREARSLHPREVVRATTTRFIRWAAEDPRRAPGHTCMTAVAGLVRARRQHKAWQTASQVYSKGCGANMRVAPAAFIHPDLVCGVAQLQAALTHGHPTALAAAELTALAIRWSAEDVDPVQLPYLLLAHARHRRGSYEGDWLGDLRGRWSVDVGTASRFGWSECEKALAQVPRLLSVRRPVADVCRVLGEGWIAEEALAVGLYFAVRYADDPALAVSEAARTSGDSDSIASITGAVVGAANGLDAWPRSWVRRIERREDLDTLVNM